VSQRKSHWLDGAGPTLHIVPGATHLLDEPGALDQVSQLAKE